MQHCAGINSVIASPDTSTLWTASRDSVIKKWSIPTSSTSSNDSPTLETDYEGHIDWVNSITLLDEQTLVSCSSDKTIRVWKAHGETDNTGVGSSVCRSEACLCGHTDYITSLAAAKSRPLVASGGLGGEVMLWDIQNSSATPVLRTTRSTSTSITTNTAPSGSSTAVPSAQIEGVIGSVYSLAMDSSGTVISAGTSDGCIWLIDTRSGRVESHLRGHTETVRALCMRPDASALLSGSSDHTIRAWDLRQRRAFSTLAVHTDSVWALAPVDDSLESVYSGGRDGCVYRTHIASKMSQLVADERNPVTALAPAALTRRGGGHSGGVDSLWVATTNSTLRCWNVGTSITNTNSTTNDPASSTKHSFVACSLPAVRSRMTFPTTTRATTIPSSPVSSTTTITTTNRPSLHPSSSIASTIAGAPPIRQIAVLTNRRHVLTQDAEDNILLWDLSIGAPVKDLGKIGTLQDAERQLFDPAHNVWPWFQPDTRLGCLAGVMESPGCFLAEAYKRDLGDASAAADAKVNMAQYMLGALFAQWAEKRTGGEEQQQPRSGANGAGGDDQMMDVDDNRTDTSNVPASPSPIAFTLQCELPPVIMVSGGNGVAPWRRTTDAFDGTEAEGDVIPQWVADCVLRKTIPTGKDLKMAFILIPAAKSGLPSLLQSKLNAPRVLGIDKVADYVMRKMADQGIHLAEEPLFWSPEKQALWAEEQRGGGGGGGSVEGGSPSSVKGSGGDAMTTGGNNDNGGNSTGTFGSLINIRQLRPISNSTGTTAAASASQSSSNQALLITCGGAAVPWDFTLAAVKQWMWKRPEDLKLEYSVREPVTPLKIPAIRAP